MDRFDEDDDLEVKSPEAGPIVLFITNVFAILVVIGLIVWSYHEFVTTKDGIAIDNIVTTAEIEDIYKSNANGVTRYYMSLNAKTYGSYDVEINQEYFITYKVGDTITISIKNNRPTIIERE